MTDLTKTEKMNFNLKNKLFDLKKKVKRLFDNMEFLAKEKNKPDLNDCRKTFEIFKKSNG
jgi:hypothetical protein